MDLMEIGCEDGRLVELAQDRVQWRTLVLAMLNLGVLLPDITWLVGYFAKRSAVKWMKLSRWHETR